MRILHVIPRITLAGTERTLADLTRLQRQQKYDVQLCSMSDSPGQSYPYDLAVDVSLNFSGDFFSPIRFGKAVQGLIAHCRDWRPDLIHAHLWPASFLAAVAAQREGIPLIVHVQDTLPWLTSSRPADVLRRFIARRLLECAGAKLIAVSKTTRQFTSRTLPWPSGAIDVVYNAVDTRYFQRKSRSNRETSVVGSAGRLVPSKGFDHLLRALSRLQKSGLSFELQIAGEGSQRNPLNQLTHQLDLDECVTFCGPVRDMREFYEQLDLFVLPSISSEGLPLSVLEAMAMELPVIATSVAGSAEAIENESTGLIVAPGDDDQLAAAINRLVTSPVEQISMGRNGRLRAEQMFSVEQLFAGVQRVYQQVLR